MKRGTRKFNGETYYLVEREMTKTAAKIEAKRLRKGGYLARVTYQPVCGLGTLGRYAVWSRKRG